MSSPVDSSSDTKLTEAEELALEARELRSLLQRERGEREQILESSSWKITAPLRELRRRFARRDAGRSQVPANPAPPVPPAQLARVSPETADGGGNETCRLLDCTSATRSLRRAPRLPARRRCVGFVGSRELAEQLDPDVELEVLREEGWHSQLAKSQVDYVLLETSWAGACGDWRYAMVRDAGVEHHRQLLDLLAYCRENHLPCVLWFREDPSNYHRFSWLIPQVERVYAIDSAIETLIAAENPRCPVGVLPPAVQPTIHNPVRSYPLQEIRDQFRRLVLFDGWWELAANERGRSIARGLTGDGLRICESQWDVSTTRLADMPELAPYVLGCVDMRDKAVLSKLVQAEIFTKAGFVASWKQREQMLRSVACGSPVGVTGWEEGRLEVPSAWCGEASEVSGWLRAIRDDPSSSARRAHLARRGILQSHCFRHRLDRIERDLGLSVDESQRLPRVSMILVTMRPQLLEACLERFRRDLYPDKELVVVLHGEHDLQEARRLVKPDEPVRVLQQGKERSLGACLNFAIELSESEYWSKVDDDDIYGPYYMTDLMLQRQVIDFDLIGKPPVFVYLQGEDALYRDPAWEKHADLWHAPGEAKAALVAGGTLTGKRSLLDQVRFCEKRRGGSDSEFVRQCYEHGRGVLAADGFNFVRYRSAESGFHTWQMDEQELRLRAVRIGGRQNIHDHVFV